MNQNENHTAGQSMANTDIPGDGNNSKLQSSYSIN